MSNDVKNGGSTGGNRLAKDFDASARPTLTVDVRRYQSLIDDPALSEAQKEEVLRALWSIVVTFVELGFGVLPLQEVCGQDCGVLSNGPKEAFDQVRLNVLDETHGDEESGPTAGMKDHEHAEP